MKEESGWTGKLLDRLDCKKMCDLTRNNDADVQQ